MAKKKSTVITARSRRDILILPLLCWAIFAGLWFLGPEQKSAWLYGGLALVCVWVSYCYLQQWLLTLEVKGEIFTVRYGFWRREYPIRELTRIRTTTSTGGSTYAVFRGIKQVAFFSSFFQNADQLVQALKARNPDLR